MATNYTNEFWNRLSFKQKSFLYRLVNDVVIFPTERFLNKWWFSLSFYRRKEIIDLLMEFLHDSRTIS